MRTLLIIFFAITALNCSYLASSAQQPSTHHGQEQPVLRVVTRLVPPFVMRAEDKKLSGFSIDLWNAVAKELGVKSQFAVTGNVKQLLAMVQSKRADVGVAAISVTSDREKVLDFSQPMFDAGLQLMVRDQSSGDSTPNILQVLLSRAMGQTLLIVLVMILVPAHVIWLVERNHEEGIIENKKYFPGIFKALWWAGGTLGAQADEMPRSSWGRVVALLWMFTGIAFVAYFTATITTAMTVQQLHGEINGPDDLPGKRIATVGGSTSDKYLATRGLRPQEYSQIADAVQALEKNQVQAVVFDAPVLQYYAANEGKNKVHVVGPIFRRESYGIAFPAGSPLRKRVNYALLKLKENGQYDEIQKRWFGESESTS